MTTAPSPGTVPASVGDRYDLTTELGRGGMASVHRAHDRVLDRPVAIKLLHAHLAQDPAFLARFRREAQAAAAFTHPNVVTVHDWGESTHGPYLVLQLVDGISLRDLLRERHRLTAGQALAVLGPAAAGLGAAHAAGVVHRDVKPENILLGRDGSVRITDFGLARAAASATATFGSDVLVGSPHYLSPEAVRGEPLDARADVYALGVVLFECLTGRPPFEGDSPFATAVAHTSRSVPAPSALRPGLAPELDALVLAATSVHRDRRPDDGAGFATQLARAVPDGPEAPAVGALPAAALAAAMPTVASRTEVLPVEDTDTEVSLGRPRRLPTALWRQTEDGSGADTPHAVATALDTVTHRDEAPQGPPDATSEPDTTPDSDADGPPDPPLPPEPAARSRGRRGLVAVLVVLGLLAASAGGGYLLWDRILAPVTDIPRVEGRAEAEARSTLAAAGFEVAVATERPYDLDVPADHVLRQDPTATARRGTVVRLTLSDGPRPVTIPALAGEDGTDALAALAAAGLAPVREETHDEDTPAEAVVRTEPPGGSVVDEASEVRVVVSLGPRPIPVPDLRGSPTAEALATLRALDLDGEVAAREHDETITAGRVLRQEPDPGETLTRGQVVALVVSDGPEPLTVPNVRGQPLREARAELERLGFRVEVELHGGFGALLNPGRVFDQDPAGGAVRFRGDEILLFAYQE